jgi:hypothetical protein
MPDAKTIARARQDKREGKSPSTQAGEFVREEIHHIREGKHGAQSPEQAIAIGLSKARRAGVKLPPKGQAAKRSRRSTARRSTRNRPSTKRARAITRALKRAGRSAASPRALGRHARTAARRRTAASRSRSARHAAKTKGPQGRSLAARKAARTRARSA